MRSETLFESAVWIFVESCGFGIANFTGFYIDITSEDAKKAIIEAKTNFLGFI